MSFERRTKKKVVRAGYVVLVQRERYEDRKKATKFRREGFLFHGRGEAEAFAKKTYSNHPYRIVGVKIDVTPFDFPPAKGSA